MIITHMKQDGLREEYRIKEDVPLTIGRSQDADIPVADERVSRIHCGIRYRDGEFVLKDLGSRNGTYLNDEKVQTATLKPGDRIRVGSTVMRMERELTKGTQTVLREVEDEMSHGKGYSTILREIVEGSQDD